MTETEKAAIDAMQNSFQYKLLLQQYPNMEVQFNEMFKSAFADGILYMASWLEAQCAKVGL